MALATTLVNLATVPRLRPRLPRRYPRVSVVVPARDEERTIERTVRALLAQTYPELEVIVVNDRSADATGAILGRYPDVIVVDNEEPPAGWLGKPWALHNGSLRATGELLLFLDADVLYDADVVTSAVARFEESGVDMLSLFPRFEMRGFWEHVVMPYLATFAFTLIPLWMANRSRRVLLAIGGGPGNLVRREAYFAAGGHAALQGAVVDDVGLARLLRSHGSRTEVVRADDEVSVRMYHGLREIVEGFTKNSFAVLEYSYLLSLLLLAGAVVVHLLPYALAVTGNALALTAVGLITVTRLILFHSLRYRLSNALLGHPLMVVTQCFILLRSIWLTGIRRRVHWRGRTYDAGTTRFGGS